MTDHALGWAGLSKGLGAMPVEAGQRSGSSLIQVDAEDWILFIYLKTFEIVSKRPVVEICLYIRVICRECGPFSSGFIHKGGVQTKPDVCCTSSQSRASAHSLSIKDTLLQTSS